ncbi:MAG: hypothetical protein JXB85_12610 [Anaerolineales bacterium]|nr:hypothetical protein [Anaerolineales bacterium]
MFTSFALFLVATIPCLYLSLKAYNRDEKNSFSILGYLLLSYVLLFGINSLILNGTGIRIGKTNLIILFGIEGTISLILLVYEIKYKRNNLLVIHKEKPAKYYGFANLLLLVLFITIASYSLVDRKDRNGYTEFYFLQEPGVQPAWQGVHSYSDQVIIRLVIHSEELNRTMYSVVVSQPDTLLSQQDFLFIEPGGSTMVEFVLPASTENITLYQFDLLRNFSTTPYRSLYIWLRRK